MNLVFNLRDMTQLACLAKALGGAEMRALDEGNLSEAENIHNLLKQIGTQFEELVSRRKLERESA